MHWQHLVKAFWMSHETIIGDGMEVPRQLAFISMMNSQSFVISRGQLLSAHHLTMWALEQRLRRLDQEEK